MSFMNVNDLNYHYEVNGTGPLLVLLHGFTGSAENWASHASVFAEYFQVITVDLPGHGLTDAPDDLVRYAMEPVAADVMSLLESITDEAANLVGYSMGGRLALYLALHYASRFQALILESASPGLKTEAERIERIERDEALADRLERDGIESFVNYWGNIPLFSTQRSLPSDRRVQLRIQRLKNRSHGLANSLRGMGTGVQPSLWSQLAELEAPVLVIAGELDVKFVEIANEMNSLLPDSKMVIVPDAGHTIHLEQVSAFQSAVMSFLWGENVDC